MSSEDRMREFNSQLETYFKIASLGLQVIPCTLISEGRRIDCVFEKEGMRATCNGEETFIPYKEIDNNEI